MFISSIPHTMNGVYQEIRRGESEWAALGNFLNDWYDYHKKRRWWLVRDPVELPENPTPDEQKWAVFCAAAVDYLCQRYHVRRPAWVSTRFYRKGLSQAWYYSPYAHLPEVREELLRETPEPFAKRNIFCGKRIFANKYEIAEDLASRRTA